MCVIIFLCLFIGHFARFLCGEIKVSLEKPNQSLQSFSNFDFRDIHYFSWGKYSERFRKICHLHVSRREAIIVNVCVFMQNFCLSVF